MLLLTRRHARPALSVQDSDVLTEALKEFADEFPALMRPLIEERDEYMVFLLRTLATRCSLLCSSLLSEVQVILRWELALRGMNALEHPGHGCSKREVQSSDAAVVRHS